MWSVAGAQLWCCFPSTHRALWSFNMSSCRAEPQPQWAHGSSYSLQVCGPFPSPRQPFHLKGKPHTNLILASLDSQVISRVFTNMKHNSWWDGHGEMVSSSSSKPATIFASETDRVCWWNSILWCWNQIVPWLKFSISACSFFLVGLDLCFLLGESFGCPKNVWW